LKYDKPLVAGVIGALSTIPSEIFSRVLLFLGIGKYSVYQLDSLLVTFTRPTATIGLIVNFILGGLIGILFYYAIKKLGQDYLVFKGIVGGLLFWAVTELIFTSTVEGRFFDLRPLSDYYVHISAAVVFGIMLGLLFKKYLFRNLSLNS